MAENINIEETNKQLTMLELSAAKAADKNQYAAKSAQTLGEAFSTAGKLLGENVINLGKATLSTSDGMSKFGGVVSSTANTVGNLAETMLKGFGPLGFVVGGLIKIVGALGVASMKQTDQLMSSYKNLSELGSVTAGGLEEIAGNLHRVGLVAEEAGKFEEVIKRITPELSNLGSVSTGITKYVDVVGGLIGPNNKIEIGLENIGYTTDAIREGTADYLAKQARQGTLQGKSTEQLRTESEKYLYSLRELGELTGLQRDQAQKLMDEQANEYRYSRYLAELEASGKKDEADKIRTYMAAYQTTFGKEAAQGLQEKLYNHGAIVGELSVRSHQATMGRDYDILQQVVKGSISASRGLIETGKSVDQNAKQFGNSINIAGDGMKEVTGGNQVLMGSLGLRGKSEEDIAKKIADRAKTEDEVSKNNKNDQIQRQLRIATDQALLQIGSMTADMFTKLNQAMLGFGKTLAGTVDWINKNIFGKETHFADAFRDIEDVTKDLTEAQKKQKADTEAVATAQKEYNESMNDANALAKFKLQMDEQEQRKKKAEDAFHYRTDFSKEGTEKLRSKMYEEQSKYRNFDELWAKSKGGKDLTVLREEKRKRLEEAKTELAKDNENIKKLNIEGTKFSSQGQSVETTSVESGSLQGLKIKKGDVQAAGATVDPRLVEIARKIQSGVTGFNYFSAFNDNYHQENAPSSAHTKGRAFDFTLDHKPSETEGQSIINALKEMNATGIDEYNHRSSNATAGHIHAEISGKTQGLFKGPDSGYLLKAHGEEALLNKQSLSNIITKSQMPNIGNNDSMDIFSSMLEMLSSLKDEMTELKNYSKSNLNVNEDILKYAKT